jgi:hypothetical protein
MRQLLGRAYGTSRQFAATIRAAPTQRRLRAVPTEGTFEAAHHGIRGLRRQVLVAAFAIGSKL